MALCKVKYCRYNNLHVTEGHKCGKCHGYGHGQLECNDDHLKKALEIYKTHRLPKNLYCKITGCHFYWLHTSKAHICGTCNNYGHGQVECCTNKTQSKIQSKIQMKIECPLCRVDNNILVDQKKIFGSEDICKVCMDNNVQIYFPQCGHICICEECAVVMNKEVTIN